MPIAYINTPGARVRVRGRSLRVEIGDDNHETSSWEITHLEGVIVVGAVTVSSRAMLLLADAGVPITFINRIGGIAARVMSAMHGHVDLRLGQHAVYAEPARRAGAARRVVAAKVRSMHAFVRQVRDANPELRDPALEERLESAIERLQEALPLPSLLGIEGAATAAYWSFFRQANRSHLRFLGRSTRPPRDEINALLSFGYTMLSSETWAVIESVGMDAHIGFYHEPANRRPALALDIIEPFRHAIVDRLVLRTVNTHRLKSADFSEGTVAGVRLSDEARAKFIGLFEEIMNQPAPRWLEQMEEDRDRTARELLHRRCLRIRDWFRTVRTEAEVGAGSAGEDDVTAPFDELPPEAADSGGGGQAA